MAAKAKEFKNCPHCGASNATDSKDGFVIHMTPKHAMRYISCPCGIMTRICKTVTELKSVWNSRPNAKVKDPKVKVKHPVTTKVDPELLKTGDNKTEAPDEF